MLQLPRMAPEAASSLVPLPSLMGLGLRYLRSAAKRFHGGMGFSAIGCSTSKPACSRARRSKSKEGVLLPAGTRYRQWAHHASMSLSLRSSLSLFRRSMAMRPALAHSHFWQAGHALLQIGRAHV